MTACARRQSSIPAAISGVSRTAVSSLIFDVRFAMRRL
jgi:hypothetical protein